MDYVLAMKAFFWGVVVFVGILGGGLSYICYLTSNGHLKRGGIWFTIVNVALIIEAVIYNLFFLLKGGLQGHVFWITLWHGLEWMVPIGIIIGGLAFLAGMVARKIKQARIVHQ